ncbi:hypothetical protein GIB67_022907 [Kingdonia uniflora]|uniref:Uncharacterized protein n=1 Tax=Kingdonia uniflora TaxID=39325 RepID=A0A7J7KW82_9MAGN|nr:hypothetical protein GIB67_022907 [Kingdonia uniflora]
MTPTLDDVKQLVGLPADGDATVIGGIWGFLAILEDSNAFKSLKARGVGNSLPLKKLKVYYAYKLEKVLSDDTAIAAKRKKGLTARSVARAYMLYVLGSFLFSMKRGTDVSARYLVLFAKDKSWIFGHFPKLAGNPKEMDSDAYEYCTCWKWDVSVTDRYGGIALLNFRDTLDNYNWRLLYETHTEIKGIPYMHSRKSPFSMTTIYLITVDLAADDDVGIHQRKPANANEQSDTPVHQSEDIAEQYDTLCKEIDSLKVVNVIFMGQIDMQLPPATPPVPDAALAKMYEVLLATHEDVKKKLIGKEDFVSHSK